MHSRDTNFSIVLAYKSANGNFRTSGAYNSHIYRDHRSHLGLDADDNESSDNLCNETTVDDAFRLPIMLELKLFRSRKEILNMMFGIFLVLINNTKNE